MIKTYKLLRTIRKHGTSYAIATAFFPKEIRDKVLLLYSFVRKPDNIVDSGYSSSHYSRAKEQLQSMLEQLAADYNALFDDSILKSGEYDGFLFLVRSAGLTLDDAEHFYAAMIQDCYKHRYNSSKEVYDYMYGSAVIVGLMMNKIMDCNNALCNYHGAELADAMQLTNFLRDIKEDYILLDRIYLSNEELAKFGLSHEDIIDICKGKRDQTTWKLFREYIKYMIAVCRKHYRNAEQGYRYLPEYARKPISLAANLYEGILDKIEYNNYDVFTKSARTTLFDKLTIIRRWKKSQKQYQ